MSKRQQIVALSFRKLYPNTKTKLYFKILFNYDELTPLAKKIETLHTIETKWRIRICCQARILTLCLHIEKVNESIFKILV